MDMILHLMPERDSEGYLIDPEAWSPDIARALAEEESVELTEAVWPIIEFMRAYWLEHRVAPDVRHVIDNLVGEHGMDRKSAKELLFRQFPYGYVKQACKIAGMMRPRAWSTG